MEHRKRKISEEEESQQNISKIFKKADFQYSLELFCDEILLVVLNYLDSESLFSLEKFGTHINRFQIFFMRLSFLEPVRDSAT